MLKGGTLSDFPPDTFQAVPPHFLLVSPLPMRLNGLRASRPASAPSAVVGGGLSVDEDLVPLKARSGASAPGGLGAGGLG